jgi:hypothetical protein
VDWVLRLPFGGLSKGAAGVHGHLEGREEDRSTAFCDLPGLMFLHSCAMVSCVEQEYQAESPPGEVYLYLACCCYYMQMYEEAEKVRGDDGTASCPLGVRALSILSLSASLTLTIACPPPYRKPSRGPTTRSATGCSSTSRTR